MLKSGILNPQINSLLSRIRHTNTLVIADRGFPFWPHIETIDIALIDDLPTVLDVLQAVVPIFQIGNSWMASEFLVSADRARIASFRKLLPTLELEPHIQFKRRVPSAIGLIRTGDTTPYANVILESA